MALDRVLHGGEPLRTVAEMRAQLADKATKIRNALAFNYCMDAGARRYNQHVLALVEQRLAHLDHA
jgi:hypothetical protein